MLRDVRIQNTVEGKPIEVRHKSGATLNEIGKLIDDAANKDIGDIIIVGGTRETIDNVPMDKIKEDLASLLEKAKTVTPHITVSSVIPRMKRPDQEQLATANGILRDACSKLAVKCVDQSGNFTFSNGDVDAAAFQKDGLHLSESGVSRLLTNLSLPPNQRKQQQQQQQQRQDGSKRSMDLDKGREALSDNGWKTVERKRHTRQRRTPGQCAKCGENNHVTAKCRHRQEVQCRQCGQWGHKEKHHTRE